MEPTSAAEATKSTYLSIPVDKIKPSRHQARKQFDEESIKDLAKSMKEEGLIQPISVRPTGEGWELVAGERRLRAAKSLGWEAIDAKVVLPASEGEAAAKGLIENLQREDLNPIEEAEGFQELNQLDEKYWNQERIAEVTGRTQGYISQSVRLLSLPNEIVKNIRALIISRSHGLELARLTGEEQQINALKVILDNKLSWEATRKLIDSIGTTKQKAAKKQHTKNTQADGFQFKMDGNRLVIQARVPLAQVEDPAQSLADLIKEAFSSWATGQPVSPLPKSPELAPEIQFALPKTEAEFRRMEEEQKNLRLPKTPAEEAQLEALAPQGPSAVYGWIYGQGSLMAQSVAKLTWQKLGFQNPIAGCRKLVETIRQVSLG